LGEADGDGVGVGLATLLERALLVVFKPGVVIGPGPVFAKYRASGTTIMPAMTVRTKVTAPHSRRRIAQSTNAKFYRRPEKAVIKELQTPRSSGRSQVFPDADAVMVRTITTRRLAGG
jgi:hypothetical protein